MSNPRRQAALRAVRTRRARDAFHRTYGDRSYWVVSDILHGLKDHVICAVNGITLATLAAYRANLTRRGTFRSMAAACRF